MTKRPIVSLSERIGRLIWAKLLEDEFPAPDSLWRANMISLGGLVVDECHDLLKEMLEDIVDDALETAAEIAETEKGDIPRAIRRAKANPKRWPK